MKSKRPKRAGLSPPCTAAMSGARRSSRRKRSRLSPHSESLPARLVGLAVHPRQLAFQPSLPLLRRHSRTLLLCLEQAPRPALDHYVDRIARLGTAVLINGTWYYLIPQSKQNRANDPAAGPAPAVPAVRRGGEQPLHRRRPRAAALNSRTDRVPRSAANRAGVFFSGDAVTGMFSCGATLTTGDAGRGGDGLHHDPGCGVGGARGDGRGLAALWAVAQRRNRHARAITTTRNPTATIRVMIQPVASADMLNMLEMLVTSIKHQSPVHEFGFRSSTRVLRRGLRFGAAHKETAALLWEAGGHKSLGDEGRSRVAAATERHGTPGEGRDQLRG